MSCVERLTAIVDIRRFEEFAEQLATAKGSRGETIAYLEATIEYLRGER